MNAVFEEPEEVMSGFGPHRFNRIGESGRAAERFQKAWDSSHTPLSQFVMEQLAEDNKNGIQETGV